MSDMNHLLRKVEAARDLKESMIPSDQRKYGFFLDEIRASVVYGESTGDSVLDWMISNRRSIDRGFHKSLIGLIDELSGHTEEPLFIINRIESSYVINPGTDDYVLEETVMAALILDAALPKDIDCLEISITDMSLRKERYSKRWSRSTLPTYKYNIPGKILEQQYKRPMQIQNDQNRRFDDENVSGFDVVCGVRDVQRYLLQEAAGTDISMVDEMLKDKEKNKDELGLLYRKVNSQWNGLKNSLPIDSGLIPEIKGLSRFAKRWYYAWLI
ncbi:hypothetical protein COV93_06560 [Candidatus Woesearchaeota archaeon CG11_big_fil_rev_8_21_14_0_20_43_8]|nr:MAG: hypothetical protein COV93_06560 [Candidatus Woesearchaeota archaeon CG11_big_fil_rev_8_21_14_0_20_43_8]